jgi:hypothetical protein
MDWVTAIGSVSYVAGVPTYSHATGVIAGAGDTDVRFAVRAETATGAREQNALVIQSAGRTTSPYGTIETSGVAESCTRGTLPEGVTSA